MAVPHLTGWPYVKLNARLSLRRAAEPLSSHYEPQIEPHHLRRNRFHLLGRMAMAFIISCGEIILRRPLKTGYPTNQRRKRSAIGADRAPNRSLRGYAEGYRSASKCGRLPASSRGDLKAVTGSAEAFWGQGRKASNAWAMRIPTLRTMKNAVIASNIDVILHDRFSKGLTFCTVKGIPLRGLKFPSA